MVVDFPAPLEVAKKPYMNFLAQNGEVGMLNPTPRGCTGGSDTGNMCVLGFNPAQYLTGRSPLEAASLGIKMEEDDVALRANLVTLSGDGPYEQKIMEDYSADEISTEEATELIACLEQHFGSETLRFYPGFSYRHCVIMHHATANEQLTPPHNITGRCIKDYMPKGDYADMLTDIMIRSNKLLSEHPVNLARAAKGKRTANSVWFWGQGTKPMLPSFRERHGLNGAVVTAVDLVKGLAFLTGMLCPRSAPKNANQAPSPGICTESMEFIYPGIPSTAGSANTPAVFVPPALKLTGPSLLPTAIVSQ